MSTFPSAPDNIQTDVENGTYEKDLHPKLHNDLASAVNAIESTLLSSSGGTLGFVEKTGDTMSGTLTLQSSLVGSVIAPADNAVVIRNGNTPQALHIYNAYLGANDWERLSLYAQGASQYVISSTASGSGVARNLALLTGGSAQISFWTSGLNRWIIQSTGTILAGTDNAQDIGSAGGAWRPRNLYLGGSVAVKVKAGPPVDADFAGPENGMLAVDSTNNRLYVRVGGVWKYTALT